MTKPQDKAKSSQRLLILSPLWTGKAVAKLELGASDGVWGVLGPHPGHGDPTSHPPFDLHAQSA